jgi:rfaE bifunctional protein kinase chain/domain
LNILENLVHQFKGKRVAVLADLVADVFLYGEIARISREAPVLILNHRDTKQVPGGGANAIANIAALGGLPYPIGVVGEDSEGERLINHFAGLGIDVSGIEKVEGYKTPTKMRVLAGMPHGYRQQVVRLDWGSTLDNPVVLKRVEKRVKTALKNTDAFMISDYGYGIVSPEMISKLQFNHVPTTLDSRFSIHKFSGMTAAAPNESEVEAALGITIGNDIAKLNKAGLKLLKKLNHTALLITRGKEGMALFERGKKPVHIPIHGSDEVADVTGAGDTVIATLTLALAARAPLYQAARLANVAGGIVVMKYGTCTVSAEELLAAIRIK